MYNKIIAYREILQGLNVDNSLRLCEGGHNWTTWESFICEIAKTITEELEYINTDSRDK